MPDPTILRVEETATAEIVATGARLRLTIAGAGSWNGNAAAERSAEVRALVAALVAAGLPEDAASLRGVTLHGESGLFGRNTRAAYAVRVRVDALDRLGAVLSAVSEQKNVSLDETGWRFDEEAARRELVRVAITGALARAGVMADALGMRVTGVRRVEDRAGVSQDTRYEGAPQALAGGIRGKGAVDPGLAVLGTRTLLHTVILEATAEREAG